MCMIGVSKVQLVLQHQMFQFRSQFLLNVYLEIVLWFIFKHRPFDWDIVCQSTTSPCLLSLVEYLGSNISIKLWTVHFTIYESNSQITVSYVDYKSLQHHFCRFSLVYLSSWNHFSWIDIISTGWLLLWVIFSFKSGSRAMSSWNNQQFLPFRLAQSKEDQ